MSRLEVKEVLEAEKAPPCTPSGECCIRRTSVHPLRAWLNRSCAVSSAVRSPNADVSEVAIRAYSVAKKCWKSEDGGDAIT
ncbi:MAG: hypothetical protein J2O47_03615 [Acidimicrobiaceae bacterium]|nr:hypothetical protein [Acidimicrobiaceae bacterium]